MLSLVQAFLVHSLTAYQRHIMLYCLQRPIQLSFQIFNAGWGGKLSVPTKLLGTGCQPNFQLRFEDAYQLFFSSKGGWTGKLLHELYGAFLIKTKREDHPLASYWMRFEVHQPSNCSWNFLIFQLNAPLRTWLLSISINESQQFLNWFVPVCLIASAGIQQALPDNNGCDGRPSSN